MKLTQMKLSNNGNEYIYNFILLFCSIVLIGLTSCASSDGVLVESNQGKITISNLTIEQNGLTPGTFSNGVEQLFIEYPDMCYDLRIDGIIRIFIDIEETGEVRESLVMRGIGGDCDEAALRAIRNAEYKPAVDSDGNPVFARHWVAISFRR